MRGHDDDPAVVGDLAQSLRDSADLCRSRCAVGSSASRSGGSSASARAIATRCCCPPERAPGPVAAAGLRGPSAPAVPGRARATGACRGPQRAAGPHVLGGGQAGNQVERLEHDADPVAAILGQHGARSPVTSRPSIVMLPRVGWRIAASIDRSGRLAAAARSRAAARARRSQTSRLEAVDRPDGLSRRCVLDDEVTAVERSSRRSERKRRVDPQRSSDRERARRQRPPRPRSRAAPEGQWAKPRPTSRPPGRSPSRSRPRAAPRAATAAPPVRRADMRWRVETPIAFRAAKSPIRSSTDR